MPESVTSIDVVERKSLDMLNVNSVCVVTQNFANIQGNEIQIGYNHRMAYRNSPKGRALLQASEPEEYVNSILSIWGNTPTLEDDVAEEDSNENQS